MANRQLASARSYATVTHDLSTTYQICDDLYVLYQGMVAEKGPTTSIIEQPRHPYVQLLISSVPVPDPRVKWGELPEIPAEETMRTSVHSGCRFYPRCPQHMDRCLAAQPPLYAVDDGTRHVACFLYEQAAG